MGLFTAKGLFDRSLMGLIGLEVEGFRLGAFGGSWLRALGV